MNDDERSNRIMMLKDALGNLPVAHTGKDAPATPVCEYCGGAGWLLLDRGDGRPQRDYCRCDYGRELAQRRMQRRYQDAHLPAMYQSLTFDTWAALPVAQRQEKFLAEAVAREFVEHWQHLVSRHAVIRRLQAMLPDAMPPGYLTALEKPDDICPGFIFSGNLGVGKTGLCGAVVNALFERGETVVYMRVLDALKALSATWQDGGERELLEEFKSAPILLMDDFGMDTAPKDHQLQYMQVIVRYRAANRLPTMVTTNLDKTAFYSQWREQTADVLFELCHFVPMKGDKLRNTRHDWEAF